MGLRRGHQHGLATRGKEIVAKGNDFETVRFCLKVLVAGKLRRQLALAFRFLYKVNKESASCLRCHSSAGSLSAFLVAGLSPVPAAGMVGWGGVGRSTT